MIFIQIQNHGYAPEDLEPTRGAKLAALGLQVQTACLDVVQPGHDSFGHGQAGDVMVDLPFDATIGGGKKEPIIAIAEVMAWPKGFDPGTPKEGPPEGSTSRDIRRTRLCEELAKAVGEKIAAYFPDGRRVYVRVRGPDSRSADWSR